MNLDQVIYDFPQKEITENGTYYYHNFKSNKLVIYNLFHKESNTIGFSQKYFYKIEDVFKLLKKNGLNMYIHKNIDGYYMVEGEFNG